MSALPFVAWRGLVGGGTLLLLSLAVGRRVGGVRRLPDLRVLDRRRRTALLVACLCGALLNIAMFAAFLRTTIAVALICFYTFPAIVNLAAVPLYGERLDRVRVGALLLSSVGLVLVVLAPVLGSSAVVVDPVGVGLALFAAVFQASFVLIAGRGFAPLPSLHVSTYLVFAAALLSAPLALLVGDLPGLLVPFTRADAWVWILLSGIAGAAIASTFFVAGIGRIGPSRAAILMTVEPLVGVLVAGMLLGEQPTLIQLVGGACVLAAAAILQMPPRAPQPVPVETEYGPLV